MFRAWYFIVVLFVVGCVPPTNQASKTVNIDLGNEDIQRIIDYRNTENIDSLIAYFDNNDATLRYLAVESFASIKSPGHLTQIGNLLTDSSSEVKAMAAYALGQQGESSIVEDLVRAFRGKDTVSVSNAPNGMVLEAIGKVEDSMKYLKFLAEQDQYRTIDTLLLTNQAKAIYRYALRGKVLPEGTNKMAEIVLDINIPHQARLYAAHYLARAKGINIKSIQFQIANLFVNEGDNDIKMALALALKNADPLPEIREILYNGLELQNDDRVKINILRSLPNYRLNDTVISSLEITDNASLKEAIANFYSNYTDATFAPLIREKAKRTRDTLYKAQLYRAYLKILPQHYTNARNAARYEIQQCLKDTLTLAEEITFIQALGYDMLSYDVLDKMLDSTTVEPLKTAIASSVTRISTSDQFNQVFSSSPRYARKKLLAIIERMIEDGDVGALYELAPALQDPQFMRLIDSTTFIENVMNDLVLPRDLETYEVLHKTVDMLNDSITESRYVPRYQPVRWDLLETINRKTEFVVKTDKGLITLTLYPDKAPESVANFARLVDENFYDGKIFHRIVPNFVAQTGCTRGDGYGSINTTIHSEVTDLYYDQEGYVGMASAGPNTESAQWFITLSPTPHLDGRYTIFGKVSSGMSTVLDLEVGDEIQDIIRID